MISQASTRILGNGQHPPRGYKRYECFEIQDVLPHIGKTSHLFQYQNKKIDVALSSRRMALLGRTQKCACCHIEGNYFWLEANSSRPHFNLYAINENGHEVLMTLDHIIPRSLGGSTEEYNIQLLCQRCNGHKKDDIISLQELWTRVYSAPKLALIVRQRQWVRRGDVIAQITNLRRKRAKVRVWCPCMEPKAFHRWNYGEYLLLTNAEIEAVKAKHESCPVNEHYGTGYAFYEMLATHLLKPASRFGVPRLSLKGVYPVMKENS